MYRTQTSNLFVDSAPCNNIDTTFSSSEFKSSEFNANNDSCAKTNLHHCVALIPSVLGFSFAYIGALGTCRNNYINSSVNMFYNSVLLITLGLLIIVFLFFAALKARLDDHLVNRIMSVCIMGQTLYPIILVGHKIYNLDNMFLLFVTEILCALASSGTVLYWIRHMCKKATTVTIISVFIALFFAETIIYILSVFPDFIKNITVAVFILMQYLCIKQAHRDDAFNPCPAAFESNCFNFVKYFIANKQSRIIAGISSACLAAASGFLQALQESFYKETLSSYESDYLVAVGIIAIVSCVYIAFAIHRYKHDINVHIFLLIETLTSFALLCYLVFPNSSIYGFAFLTVLNIFFMAGFCFMTIGFSSYGKNDPYYYALGGGVLWFGSRALARIVLLSLHAQIINNLIMYAFISIIILLSAQTMLILILNANKFGRDDKIDGTYSAQTTIDLAKVPNFDNYENQNDVRRASMQHSAQEMGRQFLLSEREVEVLALYSLGFTQKRVAEELFISTATVHAHIKRIYAKTDLHSRQDIVDYMQKYTS